MKVAFKTSNSLRWEAISRSDTWHSNLKGQSRRVAQPSRTVHASRSWGGGKITVRCRLNFPMRLYEALGGSKIVEIVTPSIQRFYFAQRFQQVFVWTTWQRVFFSPRSRCQTVVKYRNHHSKSGLCFYPCVSRAKPRRHRGDLDQRAQKKKEDLVFVPIPLLKSLAYSNREKRFSAT